MKFSMDKLKGIDQKRTIARKPKNMMVKKPCINPPIMTQASKPRSEQALASHPKGDSTTIDD